MFAVFRVSRNINGVCLSRLSANYATQKGTSTSKTSKSTTSTSSGSTGKSSSAGGYQVPEYYQHNEFTFYDFMIQMQKQRLPPPSAQK